MTFAAMMLVAMALDLLIGWPAGWFRRIGHPVTWLGRLIAWLDRRLNLGQGRRAKGVLALALTVGPVAAIGMSVQYLLPSGWVGVILGGVLGWPLIAARSMHDHVMAVIRPLEAPSLGEARTAVGMIVGRNTEGLDAPAISRAALESLAENASDGVIAPLFWGLVAGLPGIWAYKAVNTLDSMIGYRSPRYEAFGWASARLDDWVNLIPARLTALLFAAASGPARVAWDVTRRDARQHRSPNAGWPEAAMAGALEVRLSGPRAYGTGLSDDPWINPEGRDCGPGDLRRGLRLFHRMTGLAAGLLAMLAGLGWLI